MRGYIRAEKVSTVGVAAALVDSTGLAAGKRLTSFTITNTDTAKTLYLRWGASGSWRPIAPNALGDSTWEEPIPKNGTLTLYSSGTKENLPYVKGSGADTPYFAEWYYQDY